MTKELDTLAGKIIEAAIPLQKAWPISFMTRDNERAETGETQIADNAVKGILTSVYNRVFDVEVGRKGIDWEKAHNGEDGYQFMMRLPMLMPLLKRWKETGDIEYAHAMTDYIDEYVDNHSKPIDASMTVGIRNTNIVEVLPYLAESNVVDEAFLRKTVECIKGELLWLQDNISSGINWRVHCTRGIFICALYLKFLPESKHWLEISIAILNDAWFRQFLDDGVHYERNPIYHLGMTSTFHKLWKLAQQLPELGLQMDLERISKSYDFVAACARPNGWLCAIHDSQGNHAGHIDHAAGQATFGGHKSVKPYAIWKAFREETNQDTDTLDRSQFFPDAGLGFFRTDWDEDAEWVSFDATRWGGGHCHMSRNAIQLHAYRRTMIIDPGWLSYGSDEWGCHGRSTRAHSTCTLNSFNQASSNPSKTIYHHVPGYDCVFSQYDGGYWDSELKWSFTHASRGISASHARTMFWVQKRFLFVADSVFRLPHTPGDPASERPSLECNWQLSADATIELAEDAKQAVIQWPEANLLMLFPIRPAGTELTAVAGQKDPFRGWFPGESGPEPAPHLCLSVPRMDQQHDYFVTILIPTEGSQIPKVDIDAKSPMGQVGYVILRWEDGSRDEIHWGCGFEMMVGKVGDMATDSSLVHLHYTSKDVVSGACIDGTYCRPFDKTTRSKRESFVF